MDLSTSINILQWTVSDGVCADSAEISIVVRDSIFAITGTDIITCDRGVAPTALDPQFGFGYWTVLFGNATIIDSSASTPTVLNYSVGPNVFQWTVRNGECVDSATVTISIRDSSECLEPIELTNGFTPNNDGKNDYFIIKGIDAFPNNTLSVFNRWGQLVFDTSNYRNDWDGRSNGGDILPAGTYFVVFKAKGDSKTYKSYLDLRR